MIDYHLPPDMIVLDYDTFGEISLVNPSNQNVLVKYLYVRSAIPGNDFQWDLPWYINEVVEPKKPFKVDLPKLARQQYRGWTVDIFGSPQGTYAQDLSADVAKLFLSYNRNAQKLYVPAFLYRDGPEYKFVEKDIGQKITSFPCKAQLIYRFLDSQSEKDTPISCVGVIKHRTSPALR